MYITIYTRTTFACALRTSSLSVQFGACAHVYILSTYTYLNVPSAVPLPPDAGDETAIRSLPLPLTCNTQSCAWPLMVLFLNPQSSAASTTAQPVTSPRVVLRTQYVHNYLLFHFGRPLDIDPMIDSLSLQTTTNNNLNNCILRATRL